MKAKISFLLLMVLLIINACGSMQQAGSSSITTGKDYFEANSANTLKYEDYIYQPSIKAVQLHVLGNEISDPVINLNSTEKLRLAFDDLDPKVKRLSYNLILCDYDWKPSSLFNNQYLEGFFDDQITDFSNSFNTRQPYIHYELHFPNENLKILEPGNYIIMVFEDFDKTKLLLSKRFFVTQSMVSITPFIRRTSRVEDMQSKQELDFDIHLGGLTTVNPFEEIRVVIRQNGRWDNAVSNLKPLFAHKQTLQYDYDRDNVFDGGNEFRRLDLTTLRFRTEGVREILQDSLTTVILLPSANRAALNYLYFKDADGKFFIRTNEGRNPNTDADYAWVKFTFPYPEKEQNGNFYVVGGLTDWLFNDNNRMVYDSRRSAYECYLYLKQGFYNYMYAFLPNNETKAHFAFSEGNFMETENNYQIFVYYRPMGIQFDRLVGYANFTSNR